MKLKDEYSEHGYGEWMVSNEHLEDNNEACNSLDAMHNNIEKKDNNYVK